MADMFLGAPIWLDILLVPVFLAEIWLLWLLTPRLAAWLETIVPGSRPDADAANARLAEIVRQLGMTTEEATAALAALVAKPREGK